MKLDSTQQTKLVSRLNELWKEKVCEICQKKVWSIDDTVFEIREFHGGQAIIGSGAIKPVISVSCISCGNTKFMNAIQLGVVEHQKSVEETTK